MSYQPLLTLTVSHQYFADLKPRALRFEPGADCQQQLTRLARYFRPLADGFVVLADTLQPPPSTPSFVDVALYAQDPDFFAYSNLKTQTPARQVYLAHNTPTIPLAPDPADLILEQLTPPPSTSFPAFPVQLKSKLLTFQIPTQPQDVLTLTDRDQNPIKEWKIAANSQPTGFFADVRHLPAGLFILAKNGETQACFYTDDQLVQNPPALLLCLELPPRPTQNLTLTLTIPSRPVTWYYHVINQFNKRSPKDLLIVNANPTLQQNQPPITFTPSPNSPDPQNQQVFVANAPIPLQEQSYQAIELTDPRTDQAILIPHLPNPSPSSLRTIQGQWVAEMFVYI